jgi:hypothetical protein
MYDKINVKRLKKIKDKIGASDDLIYLVGTDLFRESATRDIKMLIQEVELCWKEIKDLREDLKVITDRVNEII